MNKLVQEVIRIRKTDKVFQQKKATAISNSLAISMKNHLEKTW